MKDSHLNVNFSNQSMPAKNTLAEEKIIKTAAACEKVYKLDRDAQLPKIDVTIAYAEESKK